MDDQKQKVREALSNLGATVKAIRKARKMSRAEFGQVVGIAEKTVHNIETGQGFTMESFVLILLYASLERQLVGWMKENTKAVSDLV